MMFRTIGAAVSAPNPPCSTVATTTYSGSSAGTMPANQDVSWNGGRSAVPVFPATSRSHCEKTADAVPLVVTLSNAARM